MTLTAGIVTLALGAAAPATALVQRALERGTSARVEVVDARVGLERGCVMRAVRPAAPVTHSGVVPLVVEGVAGAARCEGRGWARVRVFGQAWVLVNTVPEGASLAGAVMRTEVELLAGRVPLSKLPPGARARATLAKSTVVEARHVRGAGPGPGDRVVVEVLVGAVRLEQDAVAIACPTACARLSNGARVEGSFVDGKLRVTP